MTESPAQRYAAAKSRSKLAKSVLGGFRDSLPFELDPFQLDSCQAIQEGHGVLVAAPTSAGKTIVGQFAAYLALSQQSRCFYTTPIKALSNQKYREFVEIFGAEHVGLLTGDNSINGDAPVVVMTTEVLRNMLYEGRSGIAQLSHVVLDEVHYLADRSRGAVWEEVIIHLPSHVDVVALSATVSNAEEFGDWLRTVRGDIEVIVEEHRPTPLEQHVVVKGKMYDLFSDRKLMKVNQELGRLAFNDRSNPKARFTSRYSPSRPDVIEQLAQNDMLPAIYFIFSRGACDDAVQQALAAGLFLTTREEVLEIRGVVDAHFADADADELRILGYAVWIDGLERGIASHHAGMIPAFKEVVELLFQRGLVKVVFATETLALGINMPARSVVLEKLTKWNGTVHAPITPGEYTQLTGRAGRRGIDRQGYAVVAWHNAMDPNALAGLASARTYPLRSSFRPSYNMAINLIEKFGTHKARELLESSFAQFQADQSVVGIAMALRTSEAALEGYLNAGSCHLGDFADYMRLRDELTHLEKSQARDGSRERKFAAISVLNELVRGDVVVLDSHRRAGNAYVVLDEAANFEDPRPRVLALGGDVSRIGLTDITGRAEVVGRVAIPPTFDSRSHKSRSWLSEQLKKVSQSAVLTPKESQSPGRSEVEITRLRKALRVHPCHGCSDREEHVRWYQQIATTTKEITKLENRVEQRTSSIAREFDRICEVLTHLGYLEESSGNHTVTAAGQVLGRIYCERDLLAAECLTRGVWDELEPDQLAAAMSMLVFESRRDDDEQVPLPEGQLGQSLLGMQTIWGEIKDVENQYRTDYLPDVDNGFVWPVLRWARGQALPKVLRNSNLQPGDFVRWSKQVIDILGQVSLATPEENLSRQARAAAGAIDRGIVAW